MKKILAAAAVLTVALSATGAEANDWRRGPGYGYGHHHGGGGWVAPFVGGAIIGGLIGNAIAPRYYEPAPVYVAPPPPAYRTECSEYPVYDYSGYYMGMRRRCYQVPNY